MTATKPVTLDTAAADARFFASLHPIREQDLQTPFAPPVNALLEKLIHTDGIDAPTGFRTDLRTILRQSGVSSTSAKPSGWAGPTQIIALRSVLDARTTCKMAKLPHSTIADLTTPEAVAALEARIGKGWSSQRVTMILANLQRLAILENGACHPFVGERQAFHSAQPRRDISHRVFHPDEYLAGAHGVATMARILQITGRGHARVLLRNATLLALAAVSHLRLSEYQLLDVDDVRRRESRDGDRLLSVSVDMTKTGDSRIIVVRDARVMAMLLDLLNALPGTPLFRNADDSRICTRTVTEILWQMGELAVGEAAGANILRRARLLGKGTAEERSTDLGKSPHSKTPENHYKGNMMDAGLAFVRKVNGEALAKVKALRRASGGEPHDALPSTES